MDVAFDWSFALPAIVFTLLAIIVAHALFTKKPTTASPPRTACDEDAQAGLTEKVNKPEVETKDLTPGQTHKANKEPVPEAVPREESMHAPVPEATCVEETLLPELVPEETPEREQDNVPQPKPEKGVTPRPPPEEETEFSPVTEEQNAAAASLEEDYLSLKYTPGKLRTSQLEKMMTKEELEEEHRVQREQLAAIFQLLKDNRETFGDVTEGDVEEQLKLYSI
ncbi:matrix-remodeling-associated protein 7-like isoform X3 [Megalops cyprinoides]|uniref:matrix-remodeling-associated protein 7-like isoform X3 n=1 Tax=Megalops cyprinoides TaxID=118141 RepID=UPI0018644AAB|nr:matrix-remodeling-associated protein 7-like isoform X3 [Megalops cyprinoides]